VQIVYINSIDIARVSRHSLDTVWVLFVMCMIGRSKPDKTLLFCLCNDTEGLMGIECFEKQTKEKPDELCFKGCVWIMCDDTGVGVY
jgi:hypothetical protein